MSELNYLQVDNFFKKPNDVIDLMKKLGVYDLEKANNNAQFIQNREAVE